MSDKEECEYIEREIARVARLEAIEECARIVDSLVRLYQSYPSSAQAWRALRMASDRIRARAHQGGRR